VRGLEGHVLLTRKRAQWCLSVPDPLTDHPDAERGVGCVPDSRFQRRGAYVGLGAPDGRGGSLSPSNGPEDDPDPAGIALAGRLRGPRANSVRADRRGLTGEWAQAMGGRASPPAQADGRRRVVPSCNASRRSRSCRHPRGR
jgi:hypothetical protein